MNEDDRKVNERPPSYDSHAADEPFWKKPLADLTRSEWEQLCDGCGRCCVVKLEDEDSGQVHFTDVGCRLLDGTTGRCRDYTRRRTHVPDCVKLSRSNVETLSWLPRTCAYRLRANGKDLPGWHPLVSGDPDSVIRAGVSVRGRLAGSEDEIDADDLPDHIVRWPNRWPRPGRAKR